MRPGKTLVDGIRLALIRHRFPISQATGIFLDDLNAAIGGPTVNNDIFNVGIILVKHRLDGLIQEACLVEGRGDDGDWWKTLILLWHIKIITNKK